MSLALGPGLTDVAGSVIGVDFLAFYTGGRFFLTKRMVDLYTIQSVVGFQQSVVAPVEYTTHHPFWNPPFAVFLYAPFALDGYLPGLFAWWAFGFLCLLLAGHILSKGLITHGGLTARRLLLLALLFPPTILCFVFGQNSPLTLLIYTTVFVLLRQQHDFLAGISLGLLFYKPQLAIVPCIVLILKKRWRALVGTSLILIVWLTLGSILFPQAMHDYISFVPTIFKFVRREGYPIWGLHSLYGFSALLLDGISCEWADCFALALTLATSAALGWVWWRTSWEPGTRTWDLTFAASLALGLLISPHLFVYDLMLLLLPFVIVYHYYHIGPRGYLLDGGALLLWTAVVFAMSFAGSHLTYACLLLTEEVGLPRFGIQWSVVAIFGWSYTVIRKPREDTGTSITGETRDQLH